MKIRTPSQAKPGPRSVTASSRSESVAVVKAVADACVGSQLLAGQMEWVDATARQLARNTARRCSEKQRASGEVQKHGEGAGAFGAVQSCECGGQQD